MKSNFRNFFKLFMAAVRSRLTHSLLQHLLKDFPLIFGCGGVQGINSSKSQDNALDNLLNFLLKKIVHNYMVVTWQP